jgi:hypothetical protein
MQWLLIALLVLFSNAAFANKLTPPPQLPNMNEVQSTLKSSPVSNVVLGRFNVEFEQTTLTDIQKAADVGVIQHRGDAGGSEYWLCYTVSSHQLPHRIWISSGELGGSEHFIEHVFAVAIKKGAKASSSCPALPPQLMPPATDKALWLGANTRQLTKSFGTPSAMLGDWQIYLYTGKVSTNRVTYEREAILGAKVSNGTIVGLFESQITTN